MSPSKPTPTPTDLTVDIKGEGTHEVDLESVSTRVPDASRPTYADVLATLEVSPHEVSVLVDGRPVPEDQPVETDAMTVLRLIKGG